MDNAQLLRVLRTACPLGASLSAVVTLVSCVIIVKVNHIWVSGLSWPFLSDMGRDYPAYYVFATGLTLTAVLLVFTWFFNWRYHMSALPESAMAFRVVSFVSLIAGVLANPGLPVLVRNSNSLVPVDQRSLTSCLLLATMTTTGLFRHVQALCSACGRRRVVLLPRSYCGVPERTSIL
jgi:hypothetical protein